MSIIEVLNLSVRFGFTKVLDNISFKIEKPSLVAIVGPNGAGKTTLLRTILGYIKPLNGKIRLLGVEYCGKLPKYVKEFIGYVPQRDNVNLLVPIKVKDVIISGILDKLPLLKIKLPDEIYHKLEHIVKLLRIEDYLDEYFNSLSLGLQQKVLLARCLIREPKILLLDEPLSNVDYPSRIEIMTYLKELVLKGCTILLVCHDLDIAFNWADYVILLNRKIVKFSTPEELKKEISEEIEKHLKITQEIESKRREYCF